MDFRFTPSDFGFVGDAPRRQQVKRGGRTMERRTVLKSAAMGAVMVTSMGAMIVATKGQTTAAQPKSATNHAGENKMLNAQTLADRYVAVWNEKR
jgi:hypothetical protein